MRRFWLPLPIIILLANLLIYDLAPGGLASIVFAVIVVNANLPNSGLITMIVVCIIILSIIFHGVSANPWAKGFGERSRRGQGGAHAGK